VVLNFNLLLLSRFCRHRHETSSASHLILCLGFCSLIYDNFVVGFGSYFGESNRLRIMSKIRSLVHGVTMPLLFIPIFEVYARSSLISSSAGRIASLIAYAYATYEAIDWLKYDIQDLRLVDHRDSMKHSGLNFAGSLSYSSGKVVKMVVPAILVIFCSLGVGSQMMRNGLVAGKWMFASALFAFITSCVQIPFAQMFGESMLLAGIYKALMV
jgi:hypothetical protein